MGRLTAVVGVLAVAALALSTRGVLGVSALLPAAAAAAVAVTKAASPSANESGLTTTKHKENSKNRN